MFRNVFVGVIALFLLIACASVPHVSTPKMTTINQELLYPDIGVISKKDVGESIIVQQLGRKTFQRLAVLSEELRREADLKSSGFSLVIPAGAKGVLSDDETSACFQNLGRNAGIYGSEGRSQFCLMDSSKSGLYGRAVLRSMNNWGDFEIPSTPYRIEEIVTGYSHDSIKRELVFQGISGGQIHVLYREYTSSDMARPAFAQSVSYEISENPVIGFKGARLKVVRVTGVDINYVVEKSFSQQ